MAAGKGDKRRFQRGGRGGARGRGARPGKDCVSSPAGDGPRRGGQGRQNGYAKGQPAHKPAVPAKVPPLAGTSLKLDLGEGKWYEAEVPPVTAPRYAGAEDEHVVEERMRQAEEMQRQYEASRDGKQSGESAWLHSMMGTGTLSDRVAAMTLYFQESPLARLRVLDALLAMCAKKGRREAQMAVEAVKDLFHSDLLPDRKLRLFRAQPLAGDGVRAVHLLRWRFEDAVKQRYLQFVGALEVGSQDTMPYFRQVCLRCAAELLQSRPEQEQALLALIVNKLGDRDRKVASKSAFLLNQVVEHHPAMKGVVVREIEQFLARANLTERAQYYAVTFLNQLVLTHAEAPVARRLLALYFAHFERRVDAVRGGAEGGDIDGASTTAGGAASEARSVASAGTAGTAATFAARLSRKEYRDAVATRLLSALLTGVHRALPFAGVQASVLEKEADALFRVVFHAPLSAAVQSLMLLFQVATARQGLADRFYRALYAKLLAPEVRSTSKLTMFLNLVFRALKHDPAPERARAMTKRLLQLAALATPPFACAILVLTGAVFAARPELRGALREPEPRGEERAAAPEYDAMKRDPRFAGADNACVWEVVRGRSVLSAQ